MHQIPLPGTGRATTRLGFGCAYIVPESARLLDAAFDAGVRHFDVARSYGRGLTEGVLGRFLRRHGDEVSITTKYGIRPPFNNPMVARARALLKPLVKRLRQSPTLDRQIDQSISGMYNKAAFTGAEAETSLLTSLRRLNRTSVDIFLMHEADAADLGDPTLLMTLQGLRDNGVIGDFGVGGLARRLPQLMGERSEFCRVLQYEWTAVDPVPVHPGAFAILYRTFGGRAGEVRSALIENEKLRKDWSDEIGLDLGAPGCFERLMLKAAYDARPDAMILFSSTKPQNILANVEAVEDQRLAAPASRLAELARAQVQGQFIHGL